MTFAEFFKAVRKHDPFPWQDRLAAQVLAGEWPRAIGMPTAAGKTAVIDIAVYALAMRAPNSARRIFFVVDRRVIVDEAADDAVKLADCLDEAAPNSELGKLAQSLRDFGGDRPLETAVLRGGIPRDTAWADSPRQPAVICSTVDQVGSSLLFRGYGTSEYGRPIRAGLAAYDSLIILDEAHTSRAFAETLGAIERYRGWAEQPLELPFTVVEMSATPRFGEAIRETAEDRDNEVLKRRWGASKRTKLVAVEPHKDEDAAKGGFTGLVGGLVKEARALRDGRGAKVIGVIANRVRTARRVHDVLVKEEGCEAILLTGRSRPYDRDAIWKEWKPVIGLGGGRYAEKTVFVVATQCIEVGANLDFDGLVTEIASMDAIEQRFGRLDRDGQHEPTFASIVAQKDQVSKKYEDLLYGSAMAATWGWLSAHMTKVVREEIVPAEAKKKAKTRKVKEEFVEMGVLVLREALKATEDRAALMMPARRAPVLMPAHVDMLSQTSPEPAVSPDASVYLHGPEAGAPDVQVVWRADLGKITRDWRDMVAMCPPSAAESLAMPIVAVRRWLAQEDGGADVADIEGKAGELGRVKGKIRPVLQWRGVEESEPLEETDDVRPGMTIVAPAWYGGCDEWGWNPESVKDVDDVGDAVKLMMGRPMLRLHESLAAQWKYVELAERLRKAEQVDFKDILKETPTEEGRDPWVQKLVSTLSGLRPKGVGYPKQDLWAAVVGLAVFDQNGTGSSFGYGREVPLEEHLTRCAARAQTFAVGLPTKLRNTVERAAALHDIGKADPRFQAWLRGGNPVKLDKLIAKSKGSGQNRAAMESARKMAEYPKGARHELMSAAMLAGDAKETDDIDFELLLHLVASHHGRCRPFAPVVGDAEPVEVRFGNWLARSDHGLERVGSGVSERFWRLTRRYGWYGLAYLEAMLRLADQRESESEQKDKKAANA
jgi:CRISPR-associated endonuclease/helicase Cas3